MGFRDSGVSFFETVCIGGSTDASFLKGLLLIGFPHIGFLNGHPRSCISSVCLRGKKSSALAARVLNRASEDPQAQRPTLNPEP